MYYRNEWKYLVTDADLAVLDLSAEYTIDPERFCSMLNTAVHFLAPLLFLFPIVMTPGTSHSALLSSSTDWA